MIIVDFNAVACGLSGLRCARHGNIADAIPSEISVHYTNVCCEEFETELDAVYEKLIKRQIAVGFERMFERNGKAKLTFSLASRYSDVRAG